MTMNNRGRIVAWGKSTIATRKNSTRRRKTQPEEEDQRPKPTEPNILDILEDSYGHVGPTCKALSHGHTKCCPKK